MTVARSINKGWNQDDDKSDVWGYGDVIPSLNEFTSIEERLAIVKYFNLLFQLEKETTIRTLNCDKDHKDLLYVEENITPKPKPK
ncbi:MAG: hypothetical protein ACTSPD_18015 [Promethearchaeota archaeon]